MLSGTLKPAPLRLVPVKFVGGVLAIFAALVGAWSAWRLSGLTTPRGMRVWNSVVAMGLMGIVWVAFIGGLLRLSVNY